MPLEPEGADPDLATRLLRRVSDGDQSASEELAPLLYGSLHRIAGEWMVRQSSDHTLQPTALVNEAWLRLFSTEEIAGFAGRSHFLKAAACAMRSVLVDHARAKRSAKRGENVKPLPLDAALDVFEEQSIDVVELSEAIEQLQDYKAELAQVVELRYFAGLTIPETAEAIGVSTQTVDRRWRVARLWLQSRG